MPDYHVVYHYLRPAMELLYFAASVGVLIQIWLAKGDLQTRVSREAAKESAAQLAVWAEKIIPHFDEWMALEKAAGRPLTQCRMERFEFEELTAMALEFRVHQAAVATAIRDSPVARKCALDQCNQMEASAMTFMNGVADESLAFPALSASFCQLVEIMYPLYTGLRRAGKQNQYESTVALYGKWSARRTQFDLSAQQNQLAVAQNKVAEQAAPVKPLGA